MRHSLRIPLVIPSSIVAVALLSFASAFAVPSFSRQIGQPCSACHTHFPELNSFGRQFKLGGYTLTTEPTIDEKDSKNREVLSLPSVPFLSGMVLVSATQLSKSVPAADGATSTQNGSVLFPDQLSL